jgi:hypothetical protein
MTAELLPFRFADFQEMEHAPAVWHFLFKSYSEADVAQLSKSVSKMTIVTSFGKEMLAAITFPARITSTNFIKIFNPKNGQKSFQ